MWYEDVRIKRVMIAGCIGSLLFAVYFFVTSLLSGKISSGIWLTFFFVALAIMYIGLIIDNEKIIKLGMMIYALEIVIDLLTML